MPGRRRRLRRAAQRVRSASSLSGPICAWRATTTSRLSAHWTSRRSRPQRRRRRCGPADSSTTSRATFLESLKTTDESRDVADLPRVAARPDLGVRPVARAGRASASPARRPACPWSATPMSPSASAPTTTATSTRPRAPRWPRAPRSTSSDGRLASQPRQRRPAARRRPSGGLAHPRHRGVDGRLCARRVPGGEGRRIDHRGGPAGAPRAPSGGRAMRPRRLHRLARVLGKRATLGAMSTIACAATLAACGESDDPEPSIPQGPETR